MLKFLTRENKMTEEYNKLDSRMDFCDDRGSVTEEEIDAAIKHYDSDDYALALVEWDAANDYAKEILKSVLDFCDKLKGVDVVMMEGATLNLSNIRLFAEKSGRLDAERSIEKGLL
jgi:hypothetical protein